MSFYRGMHPGHTLARCIQKSCPLLVKLLPAVRGDTMSTDHHFFPGAALNPVFVYDSLFSQHRQDLPVMNKRSEGADIFTFLTALDGVHRNFDCIPDPLAKPCCPRDYDFHCLPAVRLRSLAFRLRKKAFFRRKTICTAENPISFDKLWQPANLAAEFNFKR
jgi:hypothetical protein